MLRLLFQDLETSRTHVTFRSKWTNLVNVPVSEPSWNLDLSSIFIHGEVYMTAEPLQLHTVPLQIIQQTSQGNEKLSSRGRANTWNQMAERVGGSDAC